MALSPYCAVSSKRLAEQVLDRSASAYHICLSPDFRIFQIPRNMMETSRLTSNTPATASVILATDLGKYMAAIGGFGGTASPS
jgi:hypothetical protein